MARFWLPVYKPAAYQTFRRKPRFGDRMLGAAAQAADELGDEQGGRGEDDETGLGGLDAGHGLGSLVSEWLTMWWD
jgi:hypothetical protein